ncbi:MAG: hypothetical protein F6J87_23000 [Spirulina sp. SIO3F2]|nr:hypothetical protein [Spirulina sp. SIO3F2]
MPPLSTAQTEADIFTRMIQPQAGTLSPDMSQFLLGLRFEAEDMARMTELAEKNNRGLLEQSEREEMERYLRVGHFLNLLHAKARQSLQYSSN